MTDDEGQQRQRQQQKRARVTEDDAEEEKSQCDDDDNMEVSSPDVEPTKKGGPEKLPHKSSSATKSRHEQHRRRRHQHHHHQHKHRTTDEEMPAGGEEIEISSDDDKMASPTADDDDKPQLGTDIMPPSPEEVVITTTAVVVTDKKQQSAKTDDVVAAAVTLEDQLQLIRKNADIGAQAAVLIEQTKYEWAITSCRKELEGAVSEFKKASEAATSAKLIADEKEKLVSAAKSKLESANEESRLYNEQLQTCPICFNKYVTLVRVSYVCRHGICFDCLVKTITAIRRTSNGPVRCSPCVAITYKKALPNSSEAPPSLPESSPHPHCDIPVWAERVGGLLDPYLVLKGHPEGEPVSPTVSRFAEAQLKYFLYAAENTVNNYGSTSSLLTNCPKCKTFVVSFASQHVPSGRCPNPKCCALFCRLCGSDYDSEAECSSKQQQKSHVHVCAKQTAEGLETVLTTTTTTTTSSSLKKCGDGSGIPSSSQPTAISVCKKCPQCSTPVLHYRDHQCHRVKCAYCMAEFCYNCLQITESGVKTTSCTKNCNPSCDDTCGCPICQECTPGRPCSACSGCCPSCRPSNC